ncbi:hypothetical protein N2152v2_006393 [Parachlorella kessleri]
MCSVLIELTDITLSGKQVAASSVPPFVLDPVLSEEALSTEGLWMINMIKCWLDEEWMALEVHGPLSRAAGEAYRRLRQEGQNDASALVLDLVAQLQGHDFQDSFTNEYEVANKVVELLMLRQGCAVCCASPADLSAIERYQGKLAAKDAEL